MFIKQPKNDNTGVKRMVVFCIKRVFFFLNSHVILFILCLTFGHKISSKHHHLQIKLFFRGWVGGILITLCNWLFFLASPLFLYAQNASIYVLLVWARAEGQGRRVAARGDKRSKMGRCLALCYALNCLEAAREPWDLQLSGGRKVKEGREMFWRRAEPRGPC